MADRLATRQEMERSVEARIAARLRRRARWQLAAFLGLAVAIALGFSQLLGLISENQKATTALCAVRADYAKRAADAEAALNLSPAQRLKLYGIRIPDATLALTIMNAQRTIKALDEAHLTCPPDPVPTS